MRISRRIIAIIMISLCLFSILTSCSGKSRVKNLFLKQTINQKEIIVERYECDEHSLIAGGKIKKQEYDRVTINWVFVSSETVFYTEEVFVQDDETFESTINNGGELWPLGEYRVDIYINGQVAKSESFSIEPIRKNEENSD